MKGYNNMLSSVTSPNTITNPTGKAVIKPDAARNQGVHPPATQKDFSAIFTKELAQARQGETVQFSKHASMRLVNREINFSKEQLQRLENGVDTARSKGIEDSLVFVDDVALVVNVKSRTVVTAMAKGQENVFTNIDGAVIV